MERLVVICDWMYKYIGIYNIILAQAYLSPIYLDSIPTVDCCIMLMSLNFKQNQNLGIASAVVASVIQVFAASNKSSSQTIYGHLHLHWQTKSNTSVLVIQKSNIKYIAHLSPVDCCIIYISLDSKQNQNLGIAFAIVASVILVLPQINSHRKLMDTYICTDKWNEVQVC